MKFASERGVLGRFACGVVKRFPTTLAVLLRVNRETSFDLNKTIRLCALAGHKEFVNVHKLGTKQP